MPHQNLEELVDKSNNSLFKLVVLAAKRAQEIADGMPKLTEADSDTKPTIIALKEIAEGKIRLAKE